MKADHKCGAHDHKCGAYDHKHTPHDDQKEAEEGHAPNHHPHVIEINGAEVAPAAAADYKKVIIGSPAALTMKTSNCCFFNSKNNSCDAKQRSASMKKLSKVVILCLIFMTIEIIGGIKANSLAILTDAAHLLSDVAGFTISLFSLWAAGWEATPRQSFGFFRIEILGTLLSIQLIWLLTGILVYEAIDRMIHRSGAQVGGMLMTIVAACGFIVNVLMAFLLGHDHHGHGHGHGHGGHSRSTTNHADHQHNHNHHHHHELADHDHHNHCNDHDHLHNHKHHSTDQADHNETVVTTMIVNGSIINGTVDDQKNQCEETGVININVKKLKMNINVEGAYLHALGDSLQSIGVMIGGAVIWWKPEWKIIDLICTLVFSIIVLSTTIGILKKIIGVLMESTPTEIDAEILEEGLLEMEEVEEVHELHIWAITVGKVLLACHVKISPDADAQVVLDKVIGYIQRVHNITHVTIQIERSSTVDNKYSVIKTTGDVEDEN